MVTCLDESSNLSDSTILKPFPPLGGMAFAFYQDNHFKNFYMHSLDDFISAREHLAQVLLSTKLIYSPIFSEESGNKVFIKPENLQKQALSRSVGLITKS